ncbi:MAG: FliA/WhiG family RNA polymerase sigma factor [Oscillospiraceae bacterium]|nr:FliA/WhiG family RNA polymerase sigma factor [Oscillospiraceae bacterium]
MENFSNNAEQIAIYQQSGDVALRNEIVLNNMGLVRSCAMSMRNMYIKHGDTDDVVNEGVIALMDAIESFDPAKGAKFETYASLKIRGAIIDFLRRQDWIPRNVRKFARTLDKANSMLYNLNGRVPTTAELAEHLGIDEDKLLKQMAECSCTITLSFEELLYEDNIDEPAVDVPSDSGLLREEMSREIASAIDELKDKERQVVTLYYYKNMKYSDIAKALGVSESRVCQIHTKAVLLLKAKLEPYFKGGTV